MGRWAAIIISAIATAVLSELCRFYLTASNGGVDRGFSALSIADKPESSYYTLLTLPPKLNLTIEGPSIPNVNNLEFIHITKTGGTSIERSAARAGIAWGKCKFKKDTDCQFPPSYQGPDASHHDSGIKQLSTECLEHKDSVPRHCPPIHMRSWECRSIYSVPWHCPPTKFRNGINPFDASKTFAVVRNPYDRLISEYYYRNRGRKFIEVRNTPQYFNQWVNETMEFIRIHGSDNIGHCIPMHEFTHDPEGNQIVDHILHLENISAEFPELMKLYGLGDKIELVHVNSVKKEHVLLGIHNLTQYNLMEVNEWAKLDCEYFGYDKIIESR
ncbi:hypothetical protein ACHAXS_012914 [Conticribra weissflogii]